MSTDRIYPVPAEFADSALINAEQYEEMYARSVDDPDGFWAEQAEEFIDWFKPWDTVQDWDFHKGEISWFSGAKVNVAFNCLDRHLETRADQTAIIWEGDDPNESRRITYRELHDEVCRFSNALKGLGVKKGDRVCIYMPMIPETAVAMLSCARIGAIHSIVFGGFSPDALKDRINDSSCSIVITADQGLRGGRKVPLKANADIACAKCESVKRMVVVRRGGEDVQWKDGRDLWYHELVSGAASECPAVEMDAEDPLFILYTSGSTGTPKGVLHTSGGYILYACMTHRYVFDYQDGDVYWCTADVGWVTGHSYIIYGPLANGATTVMFEGIPTYPSVSRFWQVVEKHKVNQFYTAPTAIRALMAHGDDPVRSVDRSSLRLLGSVGEPINPEAWEWYSRVVGDSRCPVIDTWWQTETGGIMISPMPGATALKPGSASKPFFGIVPALVDEQGNVLDGANSGNLVITRAWPGMMRSVYGNHERFRDTYFALYPGFYFTGDGARRDEDGYYWITGRIDDVLNVSGHRLGTAEIESALVLHEAVAEAAVVGYPHDIKGQGIYAYVTLMHGVEPTDELRADLIRHVREEIGPIATPDLVQWAPGLPKTRSGKIMRRILRKIAVNDVSSLGDISTLADPGVVDGLVEHRANLS
ncbi:MAG: acetate--CoA ligase [Granulosicoccus sp.]|nr:acetate--CoA ligase [Granulosicoccus sp.]